MSFSLATRRRVWPAVAWPGARRALLASVMAAMATFAISACASGHARRGGEVPHTVVHLTNDLLPPTDVTVYAVTEDGVRRLLGDVPPNDHRVLVIPGTILPGTVFHLVAERPLGRPVVSQPITASSEDAIIDWDLQTNSMWFPEVTE
jgi:hypothetical protein